MAGALRGLLNQKMRTTATPITANPPTTPPAIGPAIDELGDVVLEVEDVSVVVGERDTMTVEVEVGPVVVGEETPMTVDVEVTSVVASKGTITLGGYSSGVRVVNT